MELKNLKSKIEESASVVGCGNLALKIKKLITADNLAVKKAAVISNFTLTGLGDCLIAKAFFSDINLKVYEGQYGQWRQEVLGNGLYDFRPDIIFIILDYFGLDNENIYRLDDNLKKSASEYIKEISEYLKIIKSRSKAKIVLSTAPENWPKILGIVDNKQETGLSYTIKDINSKLISQYLKDGQVFIFDFDGWLGQIGKERYWYDKYFFLADMRLSPGAFPLLAGELVSYLVPLAVKTKKCLVLDLDNILWGGVVGEDGLNGIKLAPSGAGRPFYLFQKLILSYHNRGVILAINSKNNLDDALEVFKKHPHSSLKKDHFAAIKINWENKINNFLELAKDLNIGPEAMAFVDDDPANRAMVKKMLPQVTVIDLPADPALYHKALLSYQGFNHFEFTREDKDRGRMYKEEAKRKELKGRIPNLTNFLKSLNLKINIKELSDFNLPRAAQLTQKTNQFNFTGRRYQEEDLKKILGQGGRIWALSVKDKFGEYGLTGLIIVKSGDKAWIIDNFLLSCRILGKRIEEQFLGWVLNQLKKIDPRKVAARHLSSPKNSQVKNFYPEFGFKKLTSSGQGKTFELDLKKYNFIKINFIKIE